MQPLLLYISCWHPFSSSRATISPSHAGSQYRNKWPARSVHSYSNKGMTEKVMRRTERAGLLSSTLLLDKIVKTVWEIPLVRWKQTVEHPSKPSSSSLCFCFLPTFPSYTYSKTSPLQTSSSLAPSYSPSFSFPTSPLILPQHNLRPPKKQY